MQRPTSDPDRGVRRPSRRGAALPELPPGWPGELVTVVRSGGRGPAAARNAGWRAVTEDVEWVAFLDDDVLVTPTWLADLAADWPPAGPEVGGSQGLVTVPLPSDRPADGLGTRHRRAGDGEVDHRGHGLPAVGAARGGWLRRAFPAGLPRGRRPGAAGAGRRFRAETGRAAHHPSGSSGAVGRQRQAAARQRRRRADDASARARLVDARAGAGRPARVVICGSPAPALARWGWPRCAVARPPRSWRWPGRPAPLEFARVRIEPGPRDRAEVARMVVTSVAIPPAAVFHWLRGPRRPPLASHRCRPRRRSARPRRGWTGRSLRGYRRCWWTATAPSSSTFPTTPIRTWSSPCPARGRRWTGCGRPACR